MNAQVLTFPVPNVEAPKPRVQFPDVCWVCVAVWFAYPASLAVVLVWAL